tara:strand:+ start:901 stop:1890 length:990 start_codon:yes stop_codon:yes gene_type:complete
MNLMGTVVCEPYYRKNRIFDKTNISTAKYLDIKREFNKRNIELFTEDILPETEADFSIYIDYKRPININNNYLIVVEPQTIIKRNHQKRSLRVFNKIFTWNDDLIDNNRFVKYQLSYDFDRINIIDNKIQDGYCMVVSNKISDHNKENYSFRYKVIDFFNKKSDQFHLYGVGWEKRVHKNYFINYILKNFNQTPPQSWQGEINSKKDKEVKKWKITSKYKYQFAIENTKNINGYISEKIFDCLFAGTIPLYSGCNNINTFIPEECFINLDKFKNLNEAFNFICNLSEDDHEKIKSAGLEFLKSEKKKIFDSKYNAKLIVKNIISDLKKN